MSNYRRLRVPGGTFFFTVNLQNRKSDLLVTHIAALRTAVSKTRAELAFHIDAWSVLPDHMHCIWTLPENDLHFSGRWWSIKTLFSKTIVPIERRSWTRQKRGERGVWQRRFWEHMIRDERDFALHMDYVHFNPVKHGLVQNPADWPFSSFHRCVAWGLYPHDWAGSGVELSDQGVFS